MLAGTGARQGDPRRRRCPGGQGIDGLPPRKMRERFFYDLEARPPWVERDHLALLAVDALGEEADVVVKTARYGNNRTRWQVVDRSWRHLWGRMEFVHTCIKRIYAVKVKRSDPTFA